MTAPRAVIFDFYGTLGESDWEGGWLEALLEERGLEADVASIHRAQSDAWDGLEHLEHSVDATTYAAWERGRLRAMFEELGAVEGDLDDLVAAVEHRQRSFTVKPFPETLDVLAALRDRGIRVGVCSNWDWDLDRHLDDVGLLPLLDGRVSSAWVGARKPHPRIFHAALAEVGVDAGETVFVGDNWLADVEGPRAVGMRAVHVWRHDTDPAWLPAPPEPPEDVVRLRDLRGVLDLL